MARNTSRTAKRLAPYKAKRDFAKTAEPAAKIGKGQGWQFVVQKHDARRLHFDLRLELNGVLKSWAVPDLPLKISSTQS
jgi:bifunctional non-homologous end joining protein LigD